MNLRYNTMNFFVLYYEQLPLYKTTKFRGIIPCFFLRVHVNFFRFFSNIQNFFLVLKKRSKVKKFGYVFAKKNTLYTQEVSG